MELGGVDVAWVGELLLLPGGGGDLLRGGKLPNSSCPVSHCSGKLPLALPGLLDVQGKVKKMQNGKKGTCGSRAGKLCLAVRQGFGSVGMRGRSRFALKFKL